MKIDKINNQDLPVIKQLWKGNNDVLGIPFNQTLQELVNNGFYCIKINNEIVAFCGYQILKRKDKVKITKLYVKPEHRRKGFASMLIKKIILDTLDLKKDYIVYCRDGAENNYFYNKIGNVKEVIVKKTMLERIYEIDVNALFEGNITIEKEKTLFDYTEVN